MSKYDGHFERSWHGFSAFAPASNSTMGKRVFICKTGSYGNKRELGFSDAKSEALEIKKKRGQKSKGEEKNGT